MVTPRFKYFHKEGHVSNIADGASEVVLTIGPWSATATLVMGIRVMVELSTSTNKSWARIPHVFIYNDGGGTTMTVTNDSATPPVDELRSVHDIAATVPTVSFAINNSGGNDRLDITVDNIAASGFTVDAVIRAEVHEMLP